ncbi:MAG TPA: SGNH/GDSL hydrolase family protein [Acidimicrobiales bacterium]|nr:SGNH/GDSL hydrolase family protein [Acidimicrobiales bacterium]
MRKRVAAWSAVWGTVLVAVLGTVTLPSVTTVGAATRSPTYYVSLGDSYSVGYQPGLGATPGYASYVAKRTHLTLANFGCAGATTTSLLNTVGCPAVLPRTAGGESYPTTTQIAAAVAFIGAHKGHIGLITVSIGGNDVVPCAHASNVVGCVATAVTGITTNVTSTASQLRTAAGPKVPIIGSTYPDVILGSYVYPTDPAPASTVALAKLSVVAFKSLINPALSRAYATSFDAFVDVTKATGAYTSLTRTVHTAKYGTVPVPVASVCTLTWFCAKGDIHPMNKGYTLIGSLIVGKFDSIKKRR